MTGIGSGRSAGPGASYSVEIRTINNRFLKLSASLPDSLLALEPKIERFLRERIRRGTVSLTVVGDRLKERRFGVNRDRLNDLLADLADLDIPQADLIAPLLALPGIVEETVSSVDPEKEWPRVEQALSNALDQLDAMRREEGAAMAAELVRSLDVCARCIESIDRLAPESIRCHRDRLEDRVNSLLVDRDIVLDAKDLIREFSILAERFDTAEEIARLKSHLNQFRQILENESGVGRKLEFLTQEMYRESNTISSKANDARIAQIVVELKNEIERIREIIQNVE